MKRTAVGLAAAVALTVGAWACFNLGFGNGADTASCIVFDMMVEPAKKPIVAQSPFCQRAKEPVKHALRMGWLSVTGERVP